MLRTNKHAATYGAGGAVGGAVAQAFARERAKAFLTGRTIASVKAVADDIARTGGTLEVAQVDALDEGAVEAHLDCVMQKAGKIDVSVNAITPVAQPGIQSFPLAQLPVDSFMAPISSYLRSHFLAARAAAGRMAQGRAGVVLMPTPEPARLGLPLVGGIGPAWAMEALNRHLSAEFTSHGVRAVCSRSTGLPEAHTIDCLWLACNNDRDHRRSVPGYGRKSDAQKALHECRGSASVRSSPCIPPGERPDRNRCQSHRPGGGETCPRALV